MKLHANDNSPLLDIRRTQSPPEKYQLVKRACVGTERLQAAAPRRTTAISESDFLLCQSTHVAITLGFATFAANHGSCLFLGASLAERFATLASRQGERGSIPSRATPGFSQVGIVPDDVAGWRVFSGISRFLRFSISVPLCSQLASPSSALKTSLLRATQFSSLHFTFGFIAFTISTQHSRRLPDGAKSHSIELQEDSVLEMSATDLEAGVQTTPKVAKDTGEDMLRDGIDICGTRGLVYRAHSRNPRPESLLREEIKANDYRDQPTKIQQDAATRSTSPELGLVFTLHTVRRGHTTVLVVGDHSSVPVGSRSQPSIAYQLRRPIQVFAPASQHSRKVIRNIIQDNSPLTWANRVSIPGGVALGFSHVGVVPGYAAGRRVFSGIFPFICPCIAALLHNSPHFTLIGSQGLDVKSHPNIATPPPREPEQFGGVISSRRLSGKGGGQRREGKQPNGKDQKDQVFGHEQ
ncbi:hypothetical protein PR048_016241, partial [Dryococelus australis]